MRLLLDLQPLFAPTTAKRGIGFYAGQLARAVCLDARGHQVHLLLTHTGDPAAVVAVREAFRGLVPHERVHVLEPLLSASFPAGDRDILASINEALRESLIASLSPDCVLVTSLFELGADCPTSIARWMPGPPTAVVLYDLMPLEEPEALLADARARALYERKLEDLRRADVLLAISEHSRERAVTLLSDCPSATPIFGAAIPGAAEGSCGSPADLGGRSFVLCVGGDHPRKNMDGLVRAWARVPQALRSGRVLVLACEISARTTRMLRDTALGAGLRADEVIITGFVRPEDLAWLYTHADLFVFPSFSEGLGLPALEAMERGCPVIVADATSLRELVTVPRARFDPADPDSIASTIELALTDPALMRDLRVQSEQQAATFTWQRSAALTWDALERLGPLSPSDDAEPHRRPRLAVVSPWPPARSGVADYALATSIALGAHYDVTLVGDAPVAAGLGRVSREEFAASWWAYDQVLYHFGNSPFHTADMAQLPQAPGVLLLHDSTLAGTLRFADEPLGHPEGVEALLQESGPRSHGGGSIDQRGLRAVLSGALGVQVHSMHAASEVARAGFSQAPVAIVPHPVLEVAAAAPPKRAASSPLFVAHFGFVHAFKQPELLLEGAALAVRRLDHPVEVIFVGAVADEAYQAALQRLADRLQIRVRFLGYVSPEELGAWAASVDCAVQLRSVSHGESSGSVARLLAAGRPTVVSDIGSFADLPRDVVRHHPATGGADELAQALVECLTPEVGEALGTRAAAYAAEALSLSVWARATHETLTRAYAGNVAVQGAPGLRRASPDAPQQIRDALVAAATAASARRRGGAARVWASDVSVLAVTPFLTGIQRVTLSLHRELASVLPRQGGALVAADVAPPVVSVEPHASIRQDAVLTGVEVDVGDAEWLLCLDLNFGLPQVESRLMEARARGTRVLVNVYDLLIVSNPEWFVPRAAESAFLPWLHSVVRVADVVTVNSRATAEVLRSWVEENAPERSAALRVEVLPLGVDVPERLPPPRPRDQPPHFVVLGTIEPRKGHDDLLDAFDLLWQSGEETRLTIVGRQGWMVESLVTRLTGHREWRRRLEWLPSADDAALADVLDAADGIIVPSRGEGYGLPVVEAGVRSLPLVVRDIPVLREVAGEGATWFSGGGEELADVLADWLARWRAGEHLVPVSMDLQSWNDVARRLVDLLLHE
jgi:glycosyltransferase involved in cell wall biosynthesis